MNPTRPWTGDPKPPKPTRGGPDGKWRASCTRTDRSRPGPIPRSGSCQLPLGARSWRFYAFSEPLSFRAASRHPRLPEESRPIPRRRRETRPPKEPRGALRREQPSAVCLPERSQNRPGLSHPGNAPELPPSGPCSPRRSGPVSEPDPPVPLGRRRNAALQLRRVAPSGEAARTSRSQPARSALMAFSPLRLSLPLPWSRLPDSSSHALAWLNSHPPAGRRT